MNRFVIKGTDKMFPANWNQLAPKLNTMIFGTQLSLTFPDDNTAEITFTSAIGNKAYFNTKNTINIVEGHKYLKTIEVLDSIGTTMWIRLGGYDGVRGVKYPGSTGWQKTSVISSGTTTAMGFLGIYCDRDDKHSVDDIIKHRNWQIFDLTKMFGEGNEPSDVATFESWLAENHLDGYQPYNKGEIKSLTWPSWIPKQASSFVVRTNRLPSDYEEVEYIESHGTEYIDTGITNGVWECLAQSNNTASTKSQILFGSGSSAGQWCGTTTNNIRDFSKNVQGTTVNTKYLYQQDIIVTGSTLFRLLNNTAIYTGKVWYLVIRTDGAIVRNFVPCFRKSTTEYGLYDLISHQFFGNQGTGAFTGPSTIKDATRFTIMHQ